MAAKAFGWPCQHKTGHLRLVFDVVTKVEHIAFNEAKIRAGEILGRTDLIRVRTGRKHYQKQDARSLLNPPTENRDDRLPFIYLVSRLGIEPAHVPRPTTPVVGIRALEYFDLPSKARAKPEAGRILSLAVFSTVAADGRAHAQRIISARTDGQKPTSALGLMENRAIQRNQPSSLTANPSPRAARLSGGTRKKRLNFAYLRASRTQPLVLWRFAPGSKPGKFM